MMRLELVRDWMSRDVITAEPDMLLSDANELLTAHSIRRLPVVVNGRLAGIVTYGDIRGARPLPKLTVAQIMTPDPITVSQDATVGEAAQLMLKNRVSGLPVKDNAGALVGILTESDIFRLVVRDWLRSEGDSPEPFAHYN